MPPSFLQHCSRNYDVNWRRHSTAMTAAVLTISTKRGFINLEDRVGEGARGWNRGGTAASA